MSEWKFGTMIRRMLANGPILIMAIGEVQGNWVPVDEIGYVVDKGQWVGFTLTDNDETNPGFYPKFGTCWLEPNGSFGPTNREIEPTIP